MFIYHVVRLHSAYTCIKQGSMVGDEKMRRYKYETPILLDDSCFQTLECCLGYGHMRNVRVQLFFCVFLIVAFTFELEPHPMGDTLDSLRPHRLVQLGVKTDIRSAHRLAREFQNGLDGPRSAFFERAAVHEFVQVDGVFARDDVLEG